MNQNDENESRSTGDPADHTPHRYEWIDVDQRPWVIELSPQRLILRSGDDVIDLPERSWATDLYVVKHGQSYIVRIERFELGVRFLLPAREFAPVLSHLSNSIEQVEPPTEVADRPNRAESLLWPRVSPLAVWAVICSSLAFVPAVGLLPAAATVILLLQHRRRVPRAAAWRHSRTLCLVAFVFLVVGLTVSALASLGISRTIQGADEMAIAESVIEEQVTASQAAEGRNWGVIAAGIFVVLLSLTVHEAAHATTAWWLGDGLARSMGRVTLNPLAHIDPFGTILLPLMLIWMNGPVFGYARPVPVRVESLTRHRRAHILISLAGPGSNMLLAAASLMLLLLLGCLLRWAAPQAMVANFASFNFTSPVIASGFPLASSFAALCTMLKLSFFINTLLAGFNLVPIPPLDGSWVLEHLFPQSVGRLYAKIRPYGFMIFLGVIYLNLFQYLILPLLALWLPSMLLLGYATGFLDM